MADLSPKEVLAAWFERVWQARSTEAIATLMAPDAVGHLEGGIEVRGHAEFADFHDKLLSAFPDLSLRILRVVGDETQACLHWEVCGTHEGEIFGLAPTHKPACFTGMSFVTVRDGKITEGWDCWDQGSLIRSLSSPSI
jgi:steroid delta-isomerase-like uncharacterized protein